MLDSRKQIEDLQMEARLYLRNRDIELTITDDVDGIEDDEYLKLLKSSLKEYPYKIED